MSGTGAGGPDLGLLRAAVYRPGATSADVAALARALDGRPAETDPPSPPVAAANDAGSAEHAEEGRARPAAVWPPPRQVQGRRWAVLAAVAAAAVGCAAGAALVPLAQPAGASAAAVPTTVHISTTAGDALLHRPQRAADRPGVALDPTLVPTSLRLLLTAGQIQLYAAQDVRGRRCLVGVQGEAVVSCVGGDRFRRSGVRLLWSSDVRTIDPAGLRELRFRLALAADWRPSGAVTLGVARQ